MDYYQNLYAQQLISFSILPCISNTARLRIFNSELGLGKRLKGKG
ncbi:hypothetical protein FDUTEX481_08692 [Tolypothrix sp. PCC 7601]|nr:hypothetical protein FDUTEX481_08692 [Tolypothrix sp. PCC 7601]